MDHDCAQNCRVSEEGVRECYCNVGYELDTDEKACNGELDLLCVITKHEESINTEIIIV